MFYFVVLKVGSKALKKVLKYFSLLFMATVADTDGIVLNFFFEKDDIGKNQQITKREELPSMQRVKSTKCKVNLGLIVGD